MAGGATIKGAIRQSGKTCVLVLRPRPGGTRTARALARAGHDPVIAPLFHVESTAEACPAGDFAAAITTSVHAAALLDVRRDLPVLTVGRHSADALSQRGYRHVHVSDGARHGIAPLATQVLPAGSRLLAVLGQDRHEDWLDDLRAAGFSVDVWTAYRAVAATTLPPQAREALLRQASPAALHFSRRGAEVFLELAATAGVLPEAVAALQVVMSREVASPLIKAGAHAIAVARQPDLEGMLDALENRLAHNLGIPSGTGKDDGGSGPPDAGKADSLGESGSMSKTDDASGRGVTGKSEKAKKRSVAGKTTGSGPVVSVSSDGVAMIADDMAALPVHGTASREEHDAPQDLAMQSPQPSGMETPVAGKLLPEGPLINRPILEKPILEKPILEKPILEQPSPEQPLPEKHSGEVPSESAASAAGSHESKVHVSNGSQPNSSNPKAPGWGGLVVCGILGGILGAGGVFVAQKFLGQTTAAGSALPSTIQADLQPQLQSLERKIAGLEGASSAAAARTDLDAVNRRVEALAANASPGGAKGGMPSPELQGLSERLARAEAATAQATQAVQSALPRLAAAETATRAIGAPSPQAAAAVQLLVAERIRLALEAGRPFGTDVKALAASGAGDAALQPLAGIGANGAAITRSQLRDDIKRQRRVMSEDAVSQPAGWGERALMIASRIVSVQKLEGVAARTPPGLVAAMDAAVEAGDMQAALAAWQALPEPARRASSAFGAALAQRAAADAALKAIADNALAAVSTPLPLPR